MVEVDRNQFRAMLVGNRYYGTIVRQSGSLTLWWSPERWHSPVDGLKAQPDKWLYLGAEGWYYSADLKADFVRLTARHKMPQYPNEWIAL